MGSLQEVLFAEFPERQMSEKQQWLNEVLVAVEKIRGREES